MNERSELGHYAEEIVAEILRKKGFIISKMNYHSRFGEIDIIAETRKSLHFIEVKLRGEDALVSAVQSVDASKQKRIILTALDYISKSHTEHLQPSFDVADITETKNDNGKKTYRIKYIPDAFDAELINEFKGV